MFQKIPVKEKPVGRDAVEVMASRRAEALILFLNMLGLKGWKETTICESQRDFI